MSPFLLNSFCNELEHIRQFKQMKMLVKTAGRPIKKFKGQLRTPRWWFLSRKGNPTHPKRFRSPKGEPRPPDAVPEMGDIYRPWYKQESHLHGPKGKEGIHFYGTLQQARKALKDAKRGKSFLLDG